jgi:acyl-ACP thioesterase
VPEPELVPEPADGRAFSRTLLPGIADAVGSGRVRIDAIARWIQDVAYADIVDAGFERSGAWVLRRMRVRVDAFPRFGEEVELRTFCSGIARFAAERRTSLTGASAAVEAVAVWVWLDDEGRPGRFPQRFLDLYGPSAGGRGATVRLNHPGPEDGAARTRWRFRAADVDVAGHVNNSHYWEPLEERFAAAEPAAVDAEIEHREPAQAGEAEVVDAGNRLWIEADGSLCASLDVHVTHA